jgi:hypothetical protein
VLYLQLLKALYGCVKSALLWYELFAGTLTEMGFQLNPYDTCVANKTINGKQCTIVWYVDDNKISHVDCRVVTKIIKRIEKRFGKMTVTRGNKHVFLGMHVEYNENSTASIGMEEHLQEAISDFGEHIEKSVTSPATRDLFQVDESSEALNDARRETFHSVTAQLLYTAMRARPDVELSIAFLCTRVTKSTEQDWGKLKRALGFLKGTIKDLRILGADNIGRMKTWVDASHAVHQDMRSHTGGVVSFGIGAAMAKSTKQKINTKSSTESELVGASDYLPFAIWAKKFLEGQGYGIKENKFFQDNKSTIRFEKNGRKSCGPNSRHIDIRYFFIKDRLDIEGIEVEYCPTEDMLADFFTKPLQGSLFRKLRAVVMGHKHVDTLKEDPLPEPKERVGERTKEESETTGNVSKAGVTATRLESAEDGHEPVISTSEPGSSSSPKLSFAQVVRNDSPNSIEPSRQVKSVRRVRFAPLTLKK